MSASPDDSRRLDDELCVQQERRRSLGLARDTVLDGAVPGIDFGSNDYLGLARDPAIVAAAAAALEQFGAGGRAARLLRGGCELHERAEAAAATWLGAEAALLFPSGYQANVGLLGALVGRGDAVISDSQNHASLIDAARLSRARVLVHHHLDLDDVAQCLRSASGARRRLLVTEGVFSMSGDAAPLAELDRLCREYDAWLVVDEAHSVGLLGPQGAGACVAAGLGAGSRLCARLVTGGKALGVGGAFVVGSHALRTQLVHEARSFLFTTAPPPSLAGALCAAIERCRQADGARGELFANVARLCRGLATAQPAAAIVPVPVGDATRAVALADELRERGFYAPAVRPPTVAPGYSQLRVVCHAGHRAADVDRLAELLRERLVAASPVAPQVAAPVASMAPVTCVVGTDTGIGKTVISALLLRAAARYHVPSSYWKPVQTGDREDDDTETVSSLQDDAAAGLVRALPKLRSYELPASPHEAAADVGERVLLSDLEAALQQHRRRDPDRRIVLEFAGGLLVPFDLDPPVSQADWLARIGARVVLVARSGLGTLNHTMLTIEALRARRLEPAALFLVGPPHASNHATLRRMAGVPRIFELPSLQVVDAASLDEWLDSADLRELFA